MCNGAQCGGTPVLMGGGRSGDARVSRRGVGRAASATAGRSGRSSMLDGFQAGLSWITILRKRDAFREAFRGFDPRSWRTSARRTSLGCSRTPASSARAPRSRRRSAMRAPISRWQADGEDFSAFAWSFVGGTPVKIRRRRSGQNAALRGDLDGAEEARIQVRRARSSSMPGCRRPAWSTITCPAAFDATRSSAR